MSETDIAAAASLPAAYPLRDLVANASSIADGPRRDAALLEALRICRRELESAESEVESTRTRVEDARNTFDCASKILSGVPPSSLPLRPRDVAGSVAYWSSMKNAKRESDVYSDEDRGDRKRSREDEARASKSIADAEDRPAPVPTNPVRLPAVHRCCDDGGASRGFKGVAMSEETVSAHREGFYRRILGISASEVDDYVPSLTQPNLRSKSQLEQGVHIVKHWDTGADGVTAAVFRSKHKTWYSRMKPLSQGLGRRTGFHVRTSEPLEGREEGEMVLCRYNKDGRKSTIYLAVSQLYDALFEIHCLQDNHEKGINKVKDRVDELYANVPESMVKAFLDACPVCVERGRGGQQVVQQQQQQQQEEEIVATESV